MTDEDLVARHPCVWHMAEDGSWPGIMANGLLSTVALLDLYGVRGVARERLLSERRPRSVTIKRDGLPDAVIRDNKPMTDAGLLKCLQDGITPREWYQTLNAKTFFWVSRERLDRLLLARAYRDRPHLVLTVDTGSLVAACRGRVKLSPINSGATLYVPQTRGRDTFRPVAEFPHREMLASRPRAEPIVELVVEGGVVGIQDHTLLVERASGTSVAVVWRRPAAR